jgi:hypothetical protein
MQKLALFRRRLHSRHRMVFGIGAFDPQGFGFTVGYSEKVVGEFGREGCVGARHFISLADFDASLAPAGNKGRGDAV